MAKVNVQSIAELDAQLRQGQHVLVRNFIRAVSQSDIPDGLVLKMSQLARRCDLAKKGALLLRDRVIDLPPGFQSDAKEQAEYAACLLKLGARSEARRLLLKTSAENTPEALKYLGFTYMHEWNYKAALPLLTEYVRRTDITPYEQLIGEVNLASALVHSDAFHEALSFLIPLRERASAGGNALLLGNICELTAQAYIHLRDFRRAQEMLAASDEYLKRAQPRYRLYLRQWSALCRLYQDNSDEKALKELRSLRSMAAKLWQWEIVRELDLYESVLTGNQSLLLHVYFGTPFESLKERLLSKFGLPVVLPKSYDWGRPHAKKCLDIHTACLNDGEIFLKRGQSLHRLLLALTLDFYAPVPVPELFSVVFDEMYHPVSSPHRVYELLRRLKTASDDVGLNIKIENRARGYRIDAGHSDCKLKLTFDRGDSTDLLKQILALFPTERFRLRDLSEKVGVPHTTVYRELKDLVADGKLKVQGTGRSTTYSISSSRKAA